ncbi:hypothetical protein ABB37_02377 [Leptomonas pyrrhocoris]|uniref:Uncharacterized protein n=1 Tax=Leptomonas pyrrhocoris TaxID=157538 RepID=A0A0M9G7W7_LEPPY|nr:hypothetical protein ABB37_02377 [Leptomonas pyrrhocoris]XP_015662833.1 hypothetical protein ABB37_02377 [Leptomonas pyrrhocoris]KPA84393.1 hypothetical protein ABB37_02377 [Leptomonas pyrrhocoris]KPA84394.1 hypothetical protein ABB37_02377 [Leptomonas pyrrhocoris]|eukprot:XP_015662832.1 hypothetical protein ABB37_02377 [Leptomonas pyrrhocoris]
MVLLVPIVVVGCVAFLLISTGVVCFIHYRNIGKPVRGIVLREDSVVAVPGRVVELGQTTQNNSNASAAAPSVISGDGTHAGAPPRSETLPGRAATAADRSNSGYAMREVLNLSKGEQRRRELHNRRLSVEDTRTEYATHSDGTPPAQPVTFFRPFRPSAFQEEAEESAASPPTQQGRQIEDQAANIDYGRYLVAVNITLRESPSRPRKARKADETPIDPFGGRTEQDWAALHDTSGIDYMTNEETEYLPRNAEPREPPEVPL